MTKKTYLIIYLLLFCFIPMNMMAQKQIKLTANDKERIVKKVKKYCDMLITFSSDIENVDKMEQITGLCENDKVQTFDDLSDLTKKNNGEYHSIPLFQYLQNITTKYENSIQMSFTDIKCERTVSEPAINKDIDGNAYAIVHVVKTMKSKGLNIKLPLKITVNLRTMKIGGTVSETYEDPQMLYLKGLETRNNNDFKKAIEYFEKCFSYKSFANRYRAMTMLGFVYSTMRDWEKCINSLEIASEHDPVGGIFLANMYMVKGFGHPAKYYKPLKALTILEKYSENRDKDFPDVQAMAYLMLGIIYAQGEIVPQNLAKGLEYMTKAHTCSLEAHNLFYCYLSDYLSIGFMTMGNQNMTEALDRLCVLESQLTTFLADQTDETKQASKFQVYLTIGLLYAEKQDKTNALEYVKKLLALEMPEAYYNIAEIYKKIKLYDTAFLYYKLAAQNNDVQAAYFMELYYMPDPEIDDEADEFYKYLCTNRGDKDNQLCLYWMQKGAELGNSQCMAHLIYFYLNKPQVVPYNLKEATYWTCKYLDVLPYYSDGPYTFGQHIPYRIYKEKDKEALAELNKMANAGSHSAELMKFIYYYYVDEEHKDTIAAIEALTQSAEQGYFPALNQMAIITIEQKDSINSLYWINKMIEQNNPIGYLNLANYEQDIKKDKKKSFECLLKAYDMKCPTGAYFIGEAYRIGDYGAEINLDKAKFYFNKTLEFMPDYSGTIYDIYADSARIYLKQIEEIMLAETPYTSTGETYINNLEQLTNTSKTLECRIEEIENVSKLFASDEAVIKIVGNNGTTIVSTETSNDFLLRLATTSRKIKLKEVSCKKDNKGKITELILQEMVI